MINHTQHSQPDLDVEPSSRPTGRRGFLRTLGGVLAGTAFWSLLPMKYGHLPGDARAATTHVDEFAPNNALCD